MLINRVELGMDLPAALAAPRATQRNTTSVLAEPAFIDAYGPVLSTQYQHTFSSTSEIGAAAAVEILPNESVLAAAEPVRRGGGSAGVVKPAD